MRVAIIDSSPNENMNMPLNFPPSAQDHIHPYGVMQSFQHTNDMSCKWLTQDEIEDVEYFLIPDSSAGMNWVANNDIQICIMSLNEWMRIITVESIAKEAQRAKETLFITSAGNSGDDGETGSARRDAWMAIGAIDANNKPRSYSSYGLGKVFGVAEDGFNGLNGTSYSAPRFAGLIRFFYMMCKKYMGYYPSPNTARNWAKMNCHDVWMDGHDLNTGYGKLKLPNMWEMKDVQINIDNGATRIEREWRDGIMTEEVVDNLITAQLINDRLMLGFRDMGDALSGTVYYNSPTRNAHLM